MDLSSIKDLSKENIKNISVLHSSIVDELKQNYVKLKSDKGKVDKLLQDQALKVQQDLNSSETEKIAKAGTIDDLKKLLSESNDNQKKLEQRIINDEKARVEAGNLSTIGAFVDEFINGNVVDDQLVRGAIKTRISSSLVIRDGAILEIDKSNELTGRTGDQVLSDAKTNNMYNKHLIATRATGGGATGGGGDSDGRVVVKSITRSEYNNMPPLDAAKHFKDGGGIIT